MKVRRDFGQFDVTFIRNTRKSFQKKDKKGNREKDTLLPETVI